MAARQAAVRDGKATVTADKGHVAPSDVSMDVSALGSTWAARELTPSLGLARSPQVPGMLSTFLTSYSHTGSSLIA